MATSRKIRSNRRREIALSKVAAGQQGRIEFREVGRYLSLICLMTNMTTDDIDKVEIHYNGKEAWNVNGDWLRRRQIRLREEDPDVSSRLFIDFRDFGFVGVNNDYQSVLNLGPAGPSQLNFFEVFVTLKSTAAANAQFKISSHRMPALDVEIDPVSGRPTAAGAGFMPFVHTQFNDIVVGENDLPVKIRPGSNRSHRFLRRAWFKLDADQVDYIELRDGGSYEHLFEPAVENAIAAALGFTAPTGWVLYDPCLDDPNNLIDLRSFDDFNLHAKLKNGVAALPNTLKSVWELWGYMPNI